MENEKAMEEVELQIKLAVNESLYKKGVITNEMYCKAKDMIIRGC